MTTKLKIKLALPEEIPEPPELEVYHWDRIIFVSTLGVICLIAVGFGIRALLTNQPDSAGPVITEIAPTQDKTEKTPTPSSLKTSLSSNEHSNPSPKPIEQKETLAEPANLEEPSAPKTASISPKGKDDVKPAISTLLPSQATGAGLSSSSASKISHTATSKPQSNRQPFNEIKTEIYSPNITRFMLTNRVINNEPRGTIEDVKLDANNLAAIYAYSDAKGLKDKKLKYIWKFKDKKIAQVNIGVWSNRYRSYSSKLIQEHMQGDWEVELRDKEGKLLAFSQFKYNPVSESSSSN